MTTTIGSLDLTSANSLYNDATQYFWFESDSTATYGAGVHITLSPSATFMSNPTGQNILINTDGISIRNGLLPMMTLDNDSLDFNVVDTENGTYTNVASFGETSVIGQTNSSHLQLNKYGLQMAYGTTYDTFSVTQKNYVTTELLYDRQGYAFVDADSGEWIQNPIVFNATSIANANTTQYYGRRIIVYCEFALQDYVATFQAGTTSTVTLGQYTLTYTYISPTQCSLTLGGVTDLSEDYDIRKMFYEVAGHEVDMRVVGDVYLTGDLWINDGYSVDIGYVNYVVDSGTSGIWSWIKYRNGRIECWGEKSWSNVACTTSAGGGYRSADQTQSLPTDLFTTIESCQATMKGSGGSGYAMSLRTLCTTTTISQMFWNTTNATKSTCTVDYYIIGT